MEKIGSADLPIVEEKVEAAEGGQVVVPAHANDDQCSTTREPADRYFLVAYSWVSGQMSGSGNLWFKSPKYPSNSWIKMRASAGECYASTQIVVTNIIEMGPKDYAEFTSA